ncbi:hypothetical protein T440DRAFT_96671 [Plenodomus tracheiphilus IPT5]|uniref:Uncharacterized protein n=1 Tax=Plenodomus tracheiphilus IPT5 TaxID=1408161 RepID=A0A6A7BLI2_9PLEO|nr:hypothetical protein T440DRAFT_96671 [Plenodomus tracheiphilus IPT5]
MKTFFLFWLFQIFGLVCLVFFSSSSVYQVLCLLCEVVKWIQVREGGTSCLGPSGPLRWLADRPFVTRMQLLRLNAMIGWDCSDMVIYSRHVYL